MSAVKVAVSTSEGGNECSECGSECSEGGSEY